MYLEQTIGKDQWRIASPDGPVMFRNIYGAKWNGFYNSDGHGVFDTFIVGTEVVLYSPTWLLYCPIAFVCEGIHKIDPSADKIYIPFVAPLYVVNYVNAGIVWAYDIAIHDIPMTPIEFFYSQYQTNEDKK